MNKVEMLTSTMARSYARLRARVQGLTDEEFFWQPLPDSWTIYEDEPAHWTYHYAIPEPDPAPLTTIGWQLVHLGTTKLMYHEWAYGDALLTFPQIEIPSGAAGALQLLERGQTMLAHDLRATPDAELDEPRKTNWGDLWPAWRIFTTIADHDAFHGGVIGYLRDLYYWTSAKGRRSDRGFPPTTRRRRRGASGSTRPRR